MNTGVSKTASVQDLAAGRTRLAMDRTRFAIQRTVLAYLTAFIGVLAFGLVVWQYDRFRSAQKITFVTVTAITALAIAVFGITMTVTAVRSMAETKERLQLQ